MTRHQSPPCAPVRRPELSVRQAELLLFFAGRRALTRYQAPWGAALDRLGLIERDALTSRYRITELGQRLADQLVREQHQL